MPQANAIDRYLRDYSEPGTLPLAESLQQRQFRHVLVVPAFAEPADFLQRLTAPCDADVLTIVVVNAPDNAERAQRAQTSKLLQALNALPADNLLLIDRVTRPLPSREGVGLARKIGADVALQLIHAGVVQVPRIYFTDADATLPADYFQHRNEAAATLLYEFRHRIDDADLQRRANLYELHLRYYVAGLSLARSPYAFPTLGSTIAVTASAYAAVRGIPKRNAAEDFYLLNKLAKVAPIIRLDHPVIDLAGRLSNRVPFGTGPALAKIPADSEAYCSYAPAVFESLAQLLSALDEFARGGSWRPPGNCGVLLETLGWQRFLPPFDKLTSASQRQRRIREWFDGFRTMRYLRLVSSDTPQQELLPTLRRGFARPSAGVEELLDLLRHNGTRFTLW